MSIKRKNRKHSLSEKLKVIELYQSGYGSTTISRDLSIPLSIVKNWIRVYQVQGVKGLEIKRYKPLNSILKVQAVREVLDKSLSFETVALKYQVSIYAVYTWTQLVKLHGYAALNSIKTGRPSNVMGRPRKKKEPETELEKLQSELRYLKAENAYLKKLRALVQERIARESGKKSKPSKH
jgi:transposase